MNEEKALEEIQKYCEAIIAFMEKYNLNSHLGLSVITTILVRMILGSRMPLEMGKGVFAKVEKTYVEAKIELDKALEERGRNEKKL